MISNLIQSEKTHKLFRPQSPQKKYTTFIEFDTEKLLGSNGQNPINAGSSMFNATSDPKMEPRIREFIQIHFSKKPYLTKYEIEDREMAYTASQNLIRFKNDLAFRKTVMNSIFESNTIIFKENLYAGYIFIAVVFYFLREKNFYNATNGGEIMKKYFKSEHDFWEKLLNSLYNSSTIENLNAFCHGRFFFVDDKLSDYEDFKPTQQKIIEILKAI